MHPETVDFVPLAGKLQRQHPRSQALLRGDRFIQECLMTRKAVMQRPPYASCVNQLGPTVGLTQVTHNPAASQKQIDVQPVQIFAGRGMLADGSF